MASTAESGYRLDSLAWCPQKCPQTASQDSKKPAEDSKASRRAKSLRLHSLRDKTSRCKRMSSGANSNPALSASSSMFAPQWGTGFRPAFLIGRSAGKLRSETGPPSQSEELPYNYKILCTTYCISKKCPFQSGRRACAVRTGETPTLPAGTPVDVCLKRRATARCARSIPWPATSPPRGAGLRPMTRPSCASPGRSAAQRRQ